MVGGHERENSVGTRSSGAYCCAALTKISETSTAVRPIHQTCS